MSPTRRFQVTRVNAAGTTADRPRPDQPRVTTVRQDNYIRQRHLRNRRLSLLQMPRLVIVDGLYIVTQC